MIRIQGSLPDLSCHFPTGYGPLPNVEDMGEGAIALVNVDHNVYQDHERIPSHGGWRGWTRCYRASDLPRFCENLRDVGVDPDDVYITIFDGPDVITTWVLSEEDANRLRVGWARSHDVDIQRASEGVMSPYIGTDQRAMYKVVLEESAS